jgi:hypothetical protein
LGVELVVPEPTFVPEVMTGIIVEPDTATKNEY